MEQLAMAAFVVEWASRPTETIPVQFNPTELSFDRGVQLAEIAIPGLDAPLQQFVRGQAEKLTLDLFFDTTDQGMGAGATSVTTYTDQIYQLAKIEPTRHAPPICTFVWNEQFPGAMIGAAASGPAAAGLSIALGGAIGALGGAIGASVSALGALVGAVLGNQRRNGFRCIVESVKQRFTLFSPEGVPLRATVTVSLREYKTLEDQLKRLNLSSPDRTHSHVLGRGETLSAVAHRHYTRCGAWRAIADKNGIEDPRRIEAGQFLVVPPLE